MDNYGLKIWAQDNFTQEDGLLKVNYKSSPTLLNIIKEVREDGTRGPILLRFPHLIKKQINNLYSHFDKAICENNYNGSFNAVFPLKVNQFPHVVEAILKEGINYNYGLEAGSKAELILAMSQADSLTPISVNGFKDKEMITLGFIAAHSNHNITLTIEGTNELKTILEVQKETNLKSPKIGIRVRLHSGGSGLWAKSGGMDAKFGLTSTEIIEAIKLLKTNNMLDNLEMVHFHIGSQLNDIAPLKKALREAGNIYAELKKMGSNNLKSINIGGGLAVEYNQNKNAKTHNYSIEEFASGVVFLLREIMDAKGVEHPNIFTESGRYIVASHAVLVTPVLELFSQDYQEKLLKFKHNNPPLIEELKDLNRSLNSKNAVEYMHDALDHSESLLTLFDLGYIDLQDRSNAEILVHNIIKKALYISETLNSIELNKLQSRVQERYLINASIFQSLPDFWGIKQRFPIIPLSHLNESPLRAATLWDITCDSDGEINFDNTNPLYLHDIDLNDEEYFLGFFNVGAYQEILGMNHNLFAHPHEYTIVLNENSYEIKNQKKSKSILDILDSIGYDKNTIKKNINNKLQKNIFITEKEKNDTLSKLETLLEQNGYLRTTN